MYRLATSFWVSSRAPSPQGLSVAPKKYITTLAALLIGLCCLATTIPLGDIPPVEEGEPHKGPVLTPLVDYEDNVVTIWSPYIIYNAEVIIRDGLGSVIYQGSTNVINQTFIIILDDDVFASMSTIELIYDGHHLYGYFV